MFDLEKDVGLALDKFPKQRRIRNSNFKIVGLEGELDICDNEGNYRGSFEILVMLPYDFPFETPVVKETSHKIPRVIDRHISTNGVCCLDITHRLILEAKEGVQLDSFLQNKVYPYFANQIYFEENKEYAAGEYAHGFEGTRQFYHEFLENMTDMAIHSMLMGIVSNQTPSKYDRCFCGSGKRFDKCHFRATNALSSLGLDQLKSDLLNFENALQVSSGCIPELQK